MYRVWNYNKLNPLPRFKCWSVSKTKQIPHLMITAPPKWSLWLSPCGKNWIPSIFPLNGDFSWQWIAVEKSKSRFGLHTWWILYLPRWSHQKTMGKWTHALQPSQTALFIFRSKRLARSTAVSPIFCFCFLPVDAPRRLPFTFICLSFLVSCDNSCFSETTWYA